MSDSLARVGEFLRDWLPGMLGWTALLAGLATLMDRLLTTRVSASWRQLLLGAVFLRVALPIDWVSPLGLFAGDGGRPQQSLSVPLAASVDAEVPTLVTVLPHAVEQGLSWPVLLGGAWLFGVLVLLVRQLVLLLRLRDLLKGSLRRREDCEAGLSGLPVFEHPSLGPALVGVWRQRVVMPVGLLKEMSPRERAVVLAHEQAHHRARDPWKSLILQALMILLWPILPLWPTAALLRARMEEACDESALTSLRLSVRDYGEALLSLGQRLGTSRHGPALGLLPFGASLDGRIRSITRRRRWSNSGQATVAAVLAATLLGLAGTRVADRDGEFPPMSVASKAASPTGDVGLRRTFWQAWDLLRPLGLEDLRFETREGATYAWIQARVTSRDDEAAFRKHLALFFDDEARLPWLSAPDGEGRMLVGELLVRPTLGSSILPLRAVMGLKLIQEDGVVFRDMSFTAGGSGHVSGTAESLRRLSEFLARFEESSVFEDVQLGPTSSGPEGVGVSFDIRFVTVSPVPMDLAPMVESAGQELVTIAFHGVPLFQACQLLGERAGRNIMIPPEFSDELVTFVAKELPVEIILNRIAHALGLTVSDKGNILRLRPDGPSRSVGHVGRLQEPDEKEGPLTMSAGQSADLITMKIYAVPLAQACQLLGERAQRNIVVAERVKDWSVTLVAEELPFEAILEEMAATLGLAVFEEGNIFLVWPPGGPTSPLGEREWEELLCKHGPHGTTVRTLEHLPVKEAMEAVKELLSPRGIVQADFRSNTLIVKDCPGVQARWIETLKRIDVPRSRAKPSPE